MQALKKSGAQGKLIKIYGALSQHFDGKFNGMVSDTLGGQLIARNGIHVGVEVEGIVYDNIHKMGIPFEQWLKDFHAPGGIRVGK